MVRIKHRYLLVNILYPDPPLQLTGQSAGPNKNATALPAAVQFNQPTPNELTPQVLLRMVREHITLLYGDYGAGVTGSGLNGIEILPELKTSTYDLIVKYLSPATSTFILRCPRAHYQMVWSALTYITHLPRASKGAEPRACVMKVVRVSGTIRKAEEEAIRRARESILRAKREGKEDDVDMGTLDGLLRGGGLVEDGPEENIVDMDDGDEDESEDE
jgi:ribonuclease P/MRP protein subunit POP5